MGFFPISFVIMCLQCANISCLELRVAKCGFKTILNLSIRYNLQVFVTGLKIGILASTTFQFTVGSSPVSTCFQKCVESVVWPSIGLSFRLRELGLGVDISVYGDLGLGLPHRERPRVRTRGGRH